jgi:hypothetical protein
VLGLKQPPILAQLKRELRESNSYGKSRTNQIHRR